MTSALDSSVLVAALDALSRHHQECSALLDLMDAGIFTHALAETFNTLTGSRLGFRVPPGEAASLIREELVPYIAMKHGCVLTRDLNIQRTNMLWKFCRENKVGLFFFRPPKRDKLDYWGWTSKVFQHWAEIKREGQDHHATLCLLCGTAQEQAHGRERLILDVGQLHALNTKTSSNF